MPSATVLFDELPYPQQLDWLVDCGRGLLASLGEPQTGRLDARIEALRGLQAWQRSLLQQQQQLRWRSRNRFPHPELWLWTDKSLAQASDHWCAQFKAALFPAEERVVDACCGAGADLVALAQRGPVFGIEADPGLARLAQDNAQAHGCSGPVLTQTLSQTLPAGTDWLHIDPDRRPAGRRTTDADEFSPSLNDVLTLANGVRGAVVKLAPSTRIPGPVQEHIEHSTQRVWLGNRGECRQQLLLTGELRSGQLLRAVLCEPIAASPAGPVAMADPGTSVAGRVMPEFSSAREPPKSIVDAPQQYVYDLHHVLHAAELQSAWANRHNLQALSDAHGYYTADRPLPSAWAHAFEVLEILPWDDRQLRKWLKRNGAGTVEVKTRALGQRSIEIDANACQRRYSSTAGQAITLLVTQLGDRVRGIATRRIESPG